MEESEPLLFFKSPPLLKFWWHLRVFLRAAHLVVLRRRSTYLEWDLSLRWPLYDRRTQAHTQAKKEAKVKRSSTASLLLSTESNETGTFSERRKRRLCLCLARRKKQGEAWGLIGREWEQGKGCSSLFYAVCSGFTLRSSVVSRCARFFFFPKQRVSVCLFSSLYTHKNKKTKRISNTHDAARWVRFNPVFT